MTYDNSRYIRKCAFPCENSGYCQYAQNLEILQEAQRLVTESRQKGFKMEHGSLWCDEGGHSFSPRDNGRRLLTVRGFADDGEELEDERLVCSEHLPMIQLAKRVAIAKEETEQQYEKRTGDTWSRDHPF